MTIQKSTSPALTNGEGIGTHWWATIILIAFLLRLPFALDSGLTPDEVNYVMIARCPTVDILTGAALDESNPPLSMLLLRGVIRTVGEQIWACKLVMAGVNLLAIAVIVVLANRWLGPKIAITAGLLAAINPWQVYLATELRGYALIGLCAVVALDAADRYARRGTVGAAVVWAAACAAGFWTHYSGAPVALVTGLYGLIQVRRSRGRAGIWCFAGAISLGIMLIWAPVMRRQSIQSLQAPEHFWHLAGLPIVQCLGTTYLRPAVSRFWMVAGGLSAALVFGYLGLAGAIHFSRVRREAFRVCAAFLIVPGVVVLLRAVAIRSMVFSTRYTFVGNVTVLIVLACGLMALRGRLRTAAVLCVALLSFVSLTQFRWLYVGRSIWSEMAAKAEAEIGASDAVVFPDMVSALRARYYSHGGFPIAFAADYNNRKLAYVEPGTTWHRATSALLNPADVYSSEPVDRLKTFRTIWQFDATPGREVPALLRDDFLVVGSMPLLPGRLFGCERMSELIRYRRAKSPAGAMESH